MFWDSSALVACLLPEKHSRILHPLLQRDPAPVLWWATPVECASAFERARRDGGLKESRIREARKRLDALVDLAATVLATGAVRDRAIRLLSVHTLRAADALQLAAALVAAEDMPAETSLVTLDDRLAAAARREGFCVLPEEE